MSFWQDARFYVLCLLMVTAGLAAASYKMILMNEAQSQVYKSVWDYNCTILAVNYRVNAGTKLGDVIAQAYVMKHC